MKIKSTNLQNKRLYSLDTLRGFDMFWIIGGGMLIGLLAKTTGWHWLQIVAKQMHHVHWTGFHFEDLIFPLFMFISGVAIPFALIRKKENGVPKNVLYKKILKRMLLLVLFGFFYNGMLKHGFHNLRYASVLAQIGVAYFFAAIIAINTNSIKSRIFWVIIILASIAATQFLIEINGYGGGNFTPDKSINAWIDQHFLPGKLYNTVFDPEGILCAISAISVTLLGCVAGTVLRNGKLNAYRKIAFLLVAGIILISGALLLAPVYPIIKKMWTVPFDMLAAGISFLLLSLFYFIIDVKMWRKWILFFQVIGLNSITIYLAKHIIDFNSVSYNLLGWTKFTGNWHVVILTLGCITVEWLLLYYLFKNKIFLKV